MMNSPHDVLQLTLEMSRKKWKTPTNKLFVLAMMAGGYIALGGLFSVMVAANVGDWAISNPFLPKLLAGITFPVGLVLVSLVGAELFTGNTAYLMPATLRGEVPRYYFLRNWGIVYLGNLVGSLFVDLLLVYGADMLNPRQIEYLMHTAEYKTDLDWYVVFLRGIGANWMVCLAVWLGLASQTMLGRIVGIWIPITAFVVIGFEHSVANMFYIPTGMLYGADVSVWSMVWNNLIPSTLGNMVGGTLLVGALYSWLYD